MRKELKFRMWNCVSSNPEKSRMFYEPYEVMECLKQQLTKQYDHNADGNVFMQFTGLQDRNGVDIYSDDIIFDVSRDTGKKYRVYSVIGGFAIKEGYWNKDHSDLKPSDELILQPLADAQTKSWIASCCEVIGNIHVNPEML
jgi:uncharacterized phage protein (TIGR01671 family)